MLGRFGLQADATNHLAHGCVLAPRARGTSGDPGVREKGPEARHGHPMPVSSEGRATSQRNVRS